MARGWEGVIDNYLIKDERDSNILSKSKFIENFKAGMTLNGTRFSINFRNNEFTLVVCWDFKKNLKGKVIPGDEVLYKIYYNRGKQGPEAVYYDKIVGISDRIKGPFELYSESEDYVFKKLRDWETDKKWMRNN